MSYEDARIIQNHIKRPTYVNICHLFQHMSSIFSATCEITETYKLPAIHITAKNNFNQHIRRINEIKQQFHGSNKVIQERNKHKHLIKLPNEGIQAFIGCL